ncbi:TWO-COMPONENT HISTIDINE PROTEIN KINASE [Salix viminalis]|uniref:TWO-COMPONENT HISTIDINE PROTEIN KINASE n=1 Tax=Salix viminalis TaxID=40686 RepID=A0A9Q0SDL8_SALVM|nr:TWO-COMPONENT HISTIDINE PROTEIN KINASE [Salix viminalis]
MPALWLKPLRPYLNLKSHLVTALNVTSRILKQRSGLKGKYRRATRIVSGTRKKAAINSQCTSISIQQKPESKPKPKPKILLVEDNKINDVCMPVMNGLKATQLIRSFEETGNWDAAAKAGIEPSTSLQDGQSSIHYDKRVPIIAMTANALSESANGMDSFVSKPVTFQKLKECLEQYLT